MDKFDELVSKLPTKEHYKYLNKREMIFRSKKQEDNKFQEYVKKNNEKKQKNDYDSHDEIW